MNSSLRLSVQKISKLPTLPHIAQEILAIIECENTSAEKLEGIIKQDPAISAKILSFSSSAFFGASKPPANIQEAVVRIGFNNVKNITLGISLMTVLDDGKPHVIDYEQIYRHSLTVGLVARYLARRLKVTASPSLFLYGLLHDIGYLVLNRYYGDDYRDVIRENKQGMPILDAEKKILGFNHAEIGQWLADKWKLPEAVQYTICYHHTPAEVELYQNEVALIHLADYLTSNYFMKISVGESNYPLDSNILKIFNVTEERLETIKEQMIDENIF